MEGISPSSNVRDVELALEFEVGGKVFDDKVKITVIDVQTVSVDSSDSHTHKMPSVLNAWEAPDDHFVTVKGLSGDITLSATIFPDTAETRDQITWTNMTQDQFNKLKATKSRSSSGKFPATVNVCSRDARDLTNWVVWTARSTPSFSKTIQSGTVRTGDGTRGPGMGIGFTVSNLVFTISPATIITDIDRPNLAGSHSGSGNVPGGTQTHVLSGYSLSGGAVKKWDESRQVRLKVCNPHLYTRDELMQASGHLWNNQPVATAIPENYPPSELIGNDDTHPNEEDNDPYNMPDIGKLTGFDEPWILMRHSTGADGDTFEARCHFREFARLELGTTWYKISGFIEWKAHFKFRRVNGQWTGDGSWASADNDG